MADEAELSGEEEARAEEGGSSRAGSCAASGSGLVESENSSEDDMPVEEFDIDEQEAKDTTAIQHFHDGRDVQGIPWESLQVSREEYRRQRLQEYQNYMNCIDKADWPRVRQEMVQGWPQPTRLPTECGLYAFTRNWRGVSSSIVHFQLRNLLWAVSPHDVFVVYDNRVQPQRLVTECDSSTSASDVLDLRGAPRGHRIPGLGKVQVSTLCVSGGLLAAGGFTGELVLARLWRTDEEAWDEDEDKEDVDQDDEAAVAAAAVEDLGDGMDQDGPGWCQTSVESMAAAGEAAAADQGNVQHRPNVLGGWSEVPSCAIDKSENGITNGIEIFNSCNYGHCVMTSNNDCCVRLFDIESAQPRQRLPFPFAVNYATLRPAGVALGGGAVAAVVGDDPVTWLVDCRSGLAVIKLGGHRDFSFAAAWHPAGQLLATGNQDSTTQVWDVRSTSTPLAVLSGTMGAIRSLRFSSDGAFLAAAEPADFVHVYDVASGFADVQDIDLFGEVAGISFSPDGAHSLFVAISDTLYSSLVHYHRL
eukprot:gene5629-5868_t